MKTPFSGPSVLFGGESFFPSQDGSLVAMVAGVIKTLLDNGYERIRKVPLRKYPNSEHLSIYEREYAPREPSSVFQISADIDAVRAKVLNTESLRDMYSAFFLNTPIERRKVVLLLGEEAVGRLLQAGLMVEREGKCCLLVRFVPDGNAIFVTSAFDRELRTFTYFSYDSFMFGQYVYENIQQRKPREKMSIFDYCCGTGYVGLSVKRPEDSLTGVDLNPNAIWMADLNAKLQGKSKVKFICSGEPPSDGKKFDLVVCNPPFVFLPSEKRTGSLQIVDSDGGGDFGCEFSTVFLGKLHRLLKEGGVGFMITKTPFIGGRDHLYEVLTERYPGIGGLYHIVGDQISMPAEWEMAHGIEKYAHVVITLNAGETKCWSRRMAEGMERFRYAF